MPADSPLDENEATPRCPRVLARSYPLEIYSGSARGSRPRLRKEPCSAPGSSFPFCDTLFCLITSGHQAGAFAPRKGIVMTVPAGLNVDQYKTQAKDLLKAARAGDPEAR